jgi:hypothetical protein
MKELGVEDIDQVATQRKAAEPAAASPELMQEFLSMLTMALSKGMSVEKAKTLATEATKKIAETGKPDVVSK